MEPHVAREAVNQFRAPKRSLGDLDAEVAARLIATAADVALIVDDDGIIRDVALGNEELSREGCGAWVGQRWVDTVTKESQSKVEALLREASSSTPAKWRQINQKSARGGDVPVRFAAIPAGRGGHIVAIGRDLRTVSTLQQRLLEAQQSIERDYAKLRQAETRYRVLFHMASEPVLIVDASSEKVAEANPAATQFVGNSVKRVVGRVFPEIFDDTGAQAVRALLASVRAGARTEPTRVWLHDESREFTVSATLFRHEGGAQFLVRLTPVDLAVASEAERPLSRIMTVVERLPDGFVVTDMDGRIQLANASFLDLAQLAAEGQADGELLDRWLGRPGLDFPILLASLKENRVLRHFATIVRGTYGAVEEVEVSAVSVTEGEKPCIGFTIRAVGRRLTGEPRAARELPRSVEQLTHLVGRVSLKELVRETTDVIERLCIEAALELTGDNRASAAEILGLSRQSLYSKLRRYGLGDLSEDEE
jgi:transcriptional regulator PpsR